MEEMLDRTFTVRKLWVNPGVTRQRLRFGEYRQLKSAGPDLGRKIAEEAVMTISGFDLSAKDIKNKKNLTYYRQ